MNSRPICWTRSAIQLATQVDVGGLEVGDPVADAVFLAIHQTVPIGRLRKAGDEKTVAVVSEDDVLKDFTRKLSSNEPHLMFVTGKAGTGKSHLVRWLRSRAGEPTNWHIIYVEKRNTSLRRIIEQILSGVETPRAHALRETLAQASSDLGTVEEAMLALLQKLEQLVRFDTAQTVGDVSGATLLDLREKAGRLIGDYTFRDRLSRPGGPVERITNIAMSGGDPAVDVDELSLHLTPDDLLVEAEDFLETGPKLQNLIKLVMSNLGLRRDLAMLFDYYLARAKADVFTGRTTDLLDVFEEVRREIASRGQELCLFIEDLVLLHGIDTELAQALTIPSRSDLCRIRAVVAVTSGYLRDVTTFAERGVHYTMDVPRESVDTESLRAFVARYLNAGRLGGEALAASIGEGTTTVPNKCHDCAFVAECHAAFGTSSAGHGLYPFNGAAIDRLVRLASPTGFDPRTILREVVRGPLEVAEAELPQVGQFPSERFASSLDPHRSLVKVEDRQAIANTSDNPQQELSLRVFYALAPPTVDDDVRSAAEYFGVRLSDVDLGQALVVAGPTAIDTNPGKASPLDSWVTGTRLPANVANEIRGWIVETVASRLQTGPYGLAVRKTRKAGEWQIGSTFLRLNDIRIRAAGGEGGVESEVALRFEPRDADAVILKGVLAVAAGGSLAGPDNGRWYFELNRRLADFEEHLVRKGQGEVVADVVGALGILGVQRNLGPEAPVAPEFSLRSMFQPAQRAGLHPAAVSFAADTRSERDRALKVLRDQCTQSKGSGAPSLFDAGPFFAYVRAAALLQQLREPITGSPEMIQALTNVQQKQLRAAQTIWSDVRVIMGQIDGVLVADEDLGAAMETIDKLVDSAHSRGLLPSTDSRIQYQERRKAVDGAAIALFKRLRSRIDEPVEGSALWEVATDPTPVLRAVHSYGAIVVQLLHVIEADIAALDVGPQTGDRDRLDRAFRGLADRLDQLERDL